MLPTVHQLPQRLLDLWLGLPGSTSGWPELWLASVPLAVLLILVFRWTVRPEELTRRRNRLIARLLELLLFRHDLRVSLTAIGRILRANGAYLWTFLRPVMISAIPLTLYFAHLVPWFESRAPRAGETIAVSLVLSPDTPVLATAIESSATGALELRYPAVRIPSENTLVIPVYVRQTAVANTAVAQSEQEKLEHEKAERGQLVRGQLAVRVNNHDLRFAIPNGDELARLSAHYQQPSWFQSLVHPATQNLEAAGPVLRATVHFAPREIWLGSHQLHWSIWLFVLTMVLSAAIAMICRVPLA